MKTSSFIEIQNCRIQIKLHHDLPYSFDFKGIAQHFLGNALIC